MVIEIRIAILRVTFIVITNNGSNQMTVRWMEEILDHLLLCQIAEAASAHFLLDIER